MKTAGRETPNRWAAKLSNRAHGTEGQNIPLNYAGCEGRKIPAAGEVFFLDFPFYRTNQEFTSIRGYRRSLLGPLTCALPRS